MVKVKKWSIIKTPNFMKLNWWKKCKNELVYKKIWKELHNWDLKEDKNNRKILIKIIINWE